VIMYSPNGQDGQLGQVLGRRGRLYVFCIHNSMAHSSTLTFYSSNLTHLTHNSECVCSRHLDGQDDWHDVGPLARVARHNLLLIVVPVFGRYVRCVPTMAAGASGRYSLAYMSESPIGAFIGGPTDKIC
jgi:hypothetical protein